MNVVDIGCDEGYYAVGMAMRLPRARVYAFDINSQAQHDCAQMAVLNNVQDRVVIGGECTWEGLQQLLKPGDLVICDCEGCEAALMDPAKAPALARAFLIVELHDSEYLEPEHYANPRRPIPVDPQHRARQCDEAAGRVARSAVPRSRKSPAGGG